MQRALLVDAMISDPALLVADNVTQPLDVTVAAQVIRLMRELTARFRTAILFVSSSLPVAREAAARTLVIDAGRLVEEQPTDALVARPVHAYTRELVAQIPRIWTGVPAQPRPREACEAPRPIISLEDVSQTYRVRERGTFAGTGELRAVRNVTLDIAKGDSFAVVGESGCGKSTLMRLLSASNAPAPGGSCARGRTSPSSPAATFSASGASSSSCCRTRSTPCRRARPSARCSKRRCAFTAGATPHEFGTRSAR